MNPPLPRPIRRLPRPAFTLTELMVVLMVISILASAVLFAMYGALQDAKVSRTRTQVARIHDLLMTRWESFRTRRVRYEFAPGTSAYLRNEAKWFLNRYPFGRPPTEPRGFAHIRLLLLRELMRMELPDRKVDVWDPNLAATNWGVRIPLAFVPRPTQANPNPTPQTVYLLLPPPAVMTEYQARAPQVAWTEEYEDAECLYLILASIRDETSTGLDFLQEGEIADLDADGVPEIVDAWGRPIGMIRWAPGFIAHPGSDADYTAVADNIESYGTLQPFGVDTAGSFGVPNAVMPEDRDPFDPLRVDRRTVAAKMLKADGSAGNADYYFNFKLYPLVYSAGPDEAYDIIRWDYAPPPGDPSVKIPFDFYRTGNNDSGFNPATFWPNDPYSILPTCKRRLGEPFVSSYGYVDNITNHALGD